MSAYQVYVASSWRNPLQAEVVRLLRASGFEVYDFMDADGFRWSSIDPEWRSWTADQYVAALEHPLAKKGFKRDMDALEACDACVLVLPSGRSAHLEMGWAAGRAKVTALWTHDGEEPELMASMCDLVTPSLAAIVEFLYEKKKRKGETHI